MKVFYRLLQLCSQGGPAGYLSPVDRDAISRRGSRGVEWEADAQCVSACLQHLHRVVGKQLFLINLLLTLHSYYLAFTMINAKYKLIVKVYKASNFQAKKSYHHPQSL